MDTLRDANIELLRDPGWAVWLLVDAGVARGSAVAQAGARLAILASLFMALQSSVELAAPVVVEAYAAGQPAPIVELIAKMQVVGWPALALGWALLAVGCGARLTPRLVVAAMVAGSAAFATAGVLVEGFGVMEAAPLFAAGGLQAVWILWAGVRLAWGRAIVGHEASARPAAVAVPAATR